MGCIKIIMIKSINLKSIYKSFSSIGMTALLLLLFLAGHLSGQKSVIVYTSDHVPISYRIYGSGKPLLIINGGPGMNSDGFEGLAVSLSKDFQTIIYDQRGTGKSVMKKVDSTTITMALMISDIESIREQLGYEKWSILGHSFGGMLASAYATVHPDRIDKIILSSSGGIDLGLLSYFRESFNSKLTATQLDSIAYWDGQIAAGDTSHDVRLARGRNMAPAYVQDPKFIPVIAERLTQGNSTLNQLMWQDMRRINFNCAEKLKSYTGPLLIIQGRQDIIRPETVEKAQKAFSNSRVVYMEHCGHYGWLDNPEVYFKEVTEFLRG